MDNSLPTEFDLIVAGTGVVESIVSAAASRIGKRVLQVDVNNYYGGQWASFNLEDINNLAKTNEESTNLGFCKSLTKEKEDVIPLGNNLKGLKHFETKWHIIEKIEPEQKLKGSDGIELDKEPEAQEAVGDTSSIGQKLEEVEEGIEQCNIKEKGTDNKNFEEEPVVEVTQESIRKEYRKFIIDLCPKLQYARGEFVELLISSNIARYAEFRSVSRVLTWINGSIEIVPCSRSDVFANNKVSVVEKRMLMKLLTSIEEDEKNSTVPENTTFKDFLKGKKLSKNILHFVLYALSMSTDVTPWLQGIKNTKRFLSSLGRFGKTPFLFSMYGSGEITQAFCRLSAVFGGIFALNQALNGIILNDEKNFDSLVCGNQRVRASNIVMDVGLAPEIFLKNPEVKLISRAVFITDKSLMDSEKEHLTLLLYPYNDKLCKVLELGTLTGTCPKNLFLVHMNVEGNGDPKEDLKDCVDSLFVVGKPIEESTKPSILWSCYFSIPDTNELDSKSCIPKNVFLCPGPDIDLDFDFSVRKAREIFSSLYPGEEFLPRAPDAEEIVIGEDIETENAVEAKATGTEITPENGKSEDNLKEHLSDQSPDAEIAVEAKSSCSSSIEILEVPGTASDVLDECSEVAEKVVI